MSNADIINANNALLEAAFDNTLSRDGTAPNGMLAPIDMGGNRIINLPIAAGSADPVRKQEFDALSSQVTGLASYTLQEVTSASATIASATTVLVINRNNPSTTALTMPSVVGRSTRPLIIVDYSTNVSAHDITLTPSAGENIMRQTSWHIVSSAASLGSATFRPITEYSAWMVAP